MKRTVVVCLLAMTSLWAQEFKWPAGLENLSQKAKESVEVTLDKSMLSMASKFLSSKEPDEVRAKKIATGLNGIYVRVFEFEKPGEYSTADVDAVRAQFKAPVWKRVVGVKNMKDGENVDVFMKGSGDLLEGVMVLAVEPKELAFVFIDGPIRLEDLGELSGQFGIPKIEMQKKAAPKKAEEK